MSFSSPRVQNGPSPTASLTVSDCLVTWTASTKQRTIGERIPWENDAILFTQEFFTNSTSGDAVVSLSERRSKSGQDVRSKSGRGQDAPSTSLSHHPSPHPVSKSTPSHKNQINHDLNKQRRRAKASKQSFFAPTRLAWQELLLWLLNRCC